MNMNQVAIAYRSDEERELIKASLGLLSEPWVKDTVKADVVVLGRHGEYTAGENVAELEFCMAMGGQQFELIRYTSGPNWINEASRIGVAFPMVAHIGFHLDEGEDWPPAEFGGKLVQEAMTVEHSNAEVNAAGRRYHYRIYRVGPSAYFKFIKRLTVGPERSLATMPSMETDVMVNENRDEPKAVDPEIVTLGEAANIRHEAKSDPVAANEAKIDAATGNASAPQEAPSADGDATAADAE